MSAYRVDIPDDYTDYAHRLIQEMRAVRIAKGLKQSELGKRVGVANSHICAIETHHIIPRADLFVSLLDELGFSIHAPRT